ncbi:MAG TPA: hypothetical protein VGU45_10600 [Microvirga sp.]|jgi:hypothetical protein|nr:hypothetical protein [Microvirga sp.]
MAAAYALISLVLGVLAAALLWPIGALSALFGASLAASLGVGAISVAVALRGRREGSGGGASLPLQAHEPV